MSSHPRQKLLQVVFPVQRRPQSVNALALAKGLCPPRWYGVRRAEQRSDEEATRRRIATDTRVCN